MTQDNPSSSSTTQNPVTLTVRVEHVRDTFGIGTDRPRLSWIVEVEAQGWYQAGYEIAEYDTEGGLIGQTGPRGVGPIVLVAWPFEPLQSRERVSLRARVWGRDGDESAWSEPVLLEAGLATRRGLERPFYLARLGRKILPNPIPAPYLRREFDAAPWDQVGPAVYHRAGRV